MATPINQQVREVYECGDVADLSGSLFLPPLALIYLTTLVLAFITSSEGLCFRYGLRVCVSVCVSVCKISKKELRTDCHHNLVNYSIGHAPSEKFCQNPVVTF